MQTTSEKTRQRIAFLKNKSFFEKNISSPLPPPLSPILPSPQPSPILPSQSPTTDKIKENDKIAKHKKRVELLRSRSARLF